MDGGGSCELGRRVSGGRTGGGFVWGKGVVWVGGRAGGVEGRVGGGGDGQDATHPAPPAPLSLLRVPRVHPGGHERREGGHEGVRTREVTPNARSGGPPGISSGFAGGRGRVAAHDAAGTN